MAAHTPGPWQQAHRKGDDGYFNTEVFDITGEAIARLTWYPKPMGNGITATYREANANLIAAAPDLLEALLVLKERLEYSDPHNDMPMVETAIAKATGQ